MTGASQDPVLARAYSRIAGLLAAPPEVLSDPDVQARLGRHIGGPRYPATHPTRADFLAAIHGASLVATA